MRRFTGLFLLALVGVGCTPQATYQVSVVNQTAAPLTVGVVKDGPPAEFEWQGPEQWAIDSPLDSLPPWGHVVPPGRTMDSPPITGAFPQGTTAYLRIYRGNLSNSEMIATSDPNPDRAEVFLFPGHNEVIVRDSPKGLHAERVRAGP